MKTFNFKDKQTNVEKLFKYAKYKFPKISKQIEFDEWGQFVYFKKSQDIHYFYYVKNTNLHFTVYKKLNIKIDKRIVKDFKQKIYTADKLKTLFDAILKPLTTK